MPETNRQTSNGMRGKLVGGFVAAGSGILLAVVGFIAPFIGNGTSIALGGMGIALGIVGYTLGARRFGTATVVLCTLALFFGLAVSEGLIPSMETFMPPRKQ